MHAKHLEVDEVITLFDNRYLREYLSEDGWERETGMLERRKEQRPVAVERRDRNRARAAAAARQGAVPLLELNRGART